MANDLDSRDAVVEALSNHHGAHFCSQDTHVFARDCIRQQEQTVPELVGADQAIATQLDRSLDTS